MAVLVLPLFSPLASANASSPRKVAVGLYVNDIANYDQSTGTFSADFYLWFRWQGNWTIGDVNSTVAASIQSASLNPSDNLPSLASSAAPVHFELMNGQPINIVLISAQPNYNDSGYNFLEYRVLATMHDPVVLKNYPLDVQRLSIEMEDNFYSNTSLVYVPDVGSVIDPAITAPGGIPGWDYDAGSFNVTVISHFYNTSFGYQVVPGGNTTSFYSRFIASIDMRRPFVNSVSTLLLPVAIILAMTIVSFFIDLEKFEERLALLVTAVVSAVLLQVSIAQNTPVADTITLADKTMAIVYAVLLYALAIVVIQKIMMKGSHPRVMPWINRITLVVVPLAATLAIGLLFFSVCTTRVCDVNLLF